MILSVTHQQQYQALVASAGFAVLKGWTTVVLRGADCKSFLHNMCTNDIKSLEEGTPCEAFLTDVKGKIQAHVLVIAQHDELLLVTVPDQGKRIIEHLDRYVIREDVLLDEASTQTCWILIAGPVAAELSSDSIDLAHLIPAPTLIPGAALLKCSAENQQEVSKKLTQAGAVQVDAQVLEALRIEAAYPLYGRDFNQDHLPQEVARDEQAIHFNKGCYLGQETVARIDALGRVNQTLALLRFSGDTPPEVGSSITFDGKQVGMLTSVCCSPRENAPLGIAMLKRTASEAPTGTLLCDGQTASKLLL